jgi:hypothetical protein
MYKKIKEIGVGRGDHQKPIYLKSKGLVNASVDLPEKKGGQKSCHSLEF